VTIRGLIFDYGGVLLDMRWEFSRTLEREHGLDELSIVQTLYGDGAWRQIEIGVGDRDEWLRDAHAALEAKAGRSLPPLHEHWRAQQQLIVENIELIERLRPPYLTSVLSNADSTLVGRMRDTHRIHHLFDDIVCSADVGMAKPDPRIYTLAAQRLGVPPELCVFVDDLERNLEAARTAGMHTVHFRIDQGDSLERQLAGLGVLPQE
jgi:putative hydrolase of the HAD superfamily